MVLHALCCSAARGEGIEDVNRTKEWWNCDVEVLLLEDVASL